MTMTKQAKKEQLLGSRIKVAINNDDRAALNKYAAGASELLMFYTYTQGHARRVLGGLAGDAFETVTQDDERVLWEPERETAKVRYSLQPDYKQVSASSMPVQSWGGPYLKRISSYVVEGYFSKIQSDKIIKTVEEVASYPFDIMEFFKDNSVKQNLTTEDTAMYKAFNGMINEVEEEANGRNRSIFACYKSTFDHHSVIDSMEMHISPRKRSQPKEAMLLPEGAYIQFAKIDNTAIDGLSKRFYDEGFGDKASTVLYDTKAIRVDDASYATFRAGATLEESKFGSEFAAGDPGRLAMYQEAGYDVTTLAEMNTRYGIDTTTVDTFMRIYWLPPRNFLGKALLWGSDMKTSVNYDDDFVTFYSKEWLAYIFHNKYGITATDLWY